ncbi:PC-esterase domain-containing protein 1B [Carlito syrichta]|uniref:PC-esterase domain-containing protein 1B n=1 Tax=Carlito syrichta TaxID=1868482 RepID=A0A1U7UR09_CARSF|nr:PC-esterase domain-containing protein 1B [Carlito syrichta]
MVYLRTSEVRQLLHNKFVVILGDSVQRTVYKDLVLLLQKDCLLTRSQLKAKGELSFERDKLVAGGQLGQMHNGTSYREVRHFCSGHHLVHFYFLTRVYSEYVETILTELQSGEEAPDLVIMNSCLWDISRYGQDSWQSYQQNLGILFQRLSEVLPESCLLVWNTAMPVGQEVTGGFLLPEHQPWARSLKFSVVEANFHSFAEASKHGFDVLDLHFHFRHSMLFLQPDGVHWNERAHRHLSNLLLAHVADAWGVQLPRRHPVGKWIRDGLAKKTPGRRVEGQPQANRYHQALPLPQHFRPPRRTPLLETPRLPPLLLLQPSRTPLLQGMTRFLLRSPDTSFSSDRTFQSDQFCFHSRVSSSAQTGFSSQTNFMFGPQPLMSLLATPSSQRQAPVVLRGFHSYRPSGPYVPSRERSRPSNRGNPANSANPTSPANPSNPVPRPQ